MSEKRDLFEIPQGMKDDVSDAAKLLRGFVSHVDRRMREEHTSGLFDEVEEESAEGMLSEAAEALQQREAAFVIPEVSESASYLKGTKIPTAKEDAAERDIFGAAQRAFKEQNGTVPPISKAEKPVTADIPLYEPEDLTQTIPDMPPPAFPPREEPSTLRLQREQAPTLKNEAFSEFETSPNVPAFRPPADFTEPVDPLAVGADVTPSSRPDNYTSPSSDTGRKRKSPELSTHPSLPTVKDVSELTGSKLDTVPTKRPSALDDEIVGLGMMLDSAITSLSQDLLPAVPSQSPSKDALKTASSTSSPSRPALPDIQAFGTLEVPSVDQAAKDDDDDEENAYSVAPLLADPQDQTALEAFHKASASGELERFEGDSLQSSAPTGTAEFEVPISSSKQKVSSFSDLDAISKNLVSDLLELDLKNSLEEQVRSLTQDDLPSFSLPSEKKASEDKTDNTKLTDHTLDARPFADSPEAKSFFATSQSREAEHAATYASLPVLPTPAQDVDEGVLLREQSLDDTPFGMNNEPAGSSQPTRSMHPYQEPATPSVKMEMAAISIDDADAFAQEKNGAADTIAQMDVLHIASLAAKEAPASTKKPSSSTRPMKPFLMAPPSSAAEESPSPEKKSDISISAPASASSFTLSSEKAIEEPVSPPPSQEIAVKVEVSERKQTATESGVFASFSIGLEKAAEVPLKPSPRTEKVASPAAAAKPASAAKSQPVKVESALKTDAKPSAKAHTPIGTPHKASDAVDFDPMSENFFSSPANDLAGVHLSPEEDEFHRLVAEQKAEADRNRKILLFGGIGVILVAALMLLAIGSLQQPRKPKPDELTPEPILSRQTPPKKRAETPTTPRPSERPMLARAEGQDAGSSAPLPDARQPDASTLAGSTQGREVPVRRDEPEPVRRDEPTPVRRDEPEPVRRDEPEPVRRDEPEPVRRDEPEPIRRPIKRPVKRPVKRRAAPRNPQLAKKYHAEGMRLMFSGKLPAARQKMQSAIKADPKMADAYRVLGLIHLNLKQTKQAKRAFNQFLRLSPNAPTAPQIRSIAKSL